MQNMTKSYALPEIRTSSHGREIDSKEEEKHTEIFESKDNLRGFSTKSDRDNKDGDVLMNTSPRESQQELIKNPEGFVTLDYSKPDKQPNRGYVNRSIDLCNLHSHRSDNKLMPLTNRFSKNSTRMETLG
jgi:hypothetical protein